MTRRILAVFLAILFAALGTAAVLLYVQRADDRAVANANPVEVLVAKQRIPAGTTGESIRDRDLVEPMKLPAGSVPVDEALTQLPPELDKLVVTSDLQPGQLVLRRMFSQSTRTSGGLAIPEGKVAVSFEATLAEQVAGYVRPGSQVAVFVRYRVTADTKVKAVDGGKSGDDVKGTAVLLPKIEVIAIGSYGEGGQTTTTPLTRETGQQGDRQATVLVTVAVDTIQAAKLIHAAAENAIYLALLTDSSNVRPGAGVDSSTFLG
jgi:pilus assembly protein CpaB